MGIAFFTFGGMFAPLHGLIGWLGHRLRRVEAVSARPCEKARRPLRVVRVVEGGAPASAGRMFISGRMADVCAELDRLAALEAAAG